MSVKENARYGMASAQDDRAPDLDNSSFFPNRRWRAIPRYDRV